MATITSASGGGGGSAASGSGGSGASANNMFRVGDYVYFENSASASYAIRRIEELNKTPNGNVEARVMCFYRRSELPTSLIGQADKHHWGDDVLTEDPDSDDEDSKQATVRSEREQMKLREVFLSRNVETLPATLIRGKCSVTLLSEVETVHSYTDRDDAFFYALVYDPHQKTLVADRGEIRIGSGYQASIPTLLKDGESDGRCSADLEERCWNTSKPLEDGDTEKFLIIARSVGTFARALDCSSSVKQPSLHMSAAAASRDITLFHAHDLLHKHNYEVAAALKALVPATGPVLCRDEMEDWSASEANLFEEAIEKYGKDFNDIKKDFLPWKSMRNIIEYFFMWKTTDRYVQQKRIKAMEAESKLKQVYVPAYSNKSTRLTGQNGEVIIRGRDCDAYPKLEKYSWVHYKKYGKFVLAKTLDDCFILDKSLAYRDVANLTRARPGLIIEPGSPAKPSGPGGGVGGVGGGGGPSGQGGSGKTRAAFYLRTTPLTRASRRVCAPGGVRLRHFARKPGKTLDMKAVKADAQAKMVGMSETTVRRLNAFRAKDRVPMSVVVKRLGQKDDSIHAWLVLTPKHLIPKPVKEFYPRPKKRPDGSYIYDRIPGAADTFAPQPPQLFYPKKRAFESSAAEKPAQTDQSAKIMRTSDAPAAAAAPSTSTIGGGRGYAPNQVPPKGRVATVTRIQGGQKQVISWMDAPDDVFYRATASTKRLRKKLPVLQLRRAARKPFKKVIQLPPA